MMDLSKLPRLSDTQKAAKDAQSAPEVSSDSPAPPPAATPAANTFCFQCGAALRPGARFCDSCGTALDVPPSTGGTGGLAAEIWVSLILGIIFVLLGFRFARYTWATVRGNEFDTQTTWVAGEKAGTNVGYWELQDLSAWTDSAVFLFGLALVFEALAMFVAVFRSRARRWVLIVALLVTVLATAYNGVVAGKFFAHGLMPLLSLLAVAVGGYIAFYQWQQLRTLPT